MSQNAFFRSSDSYNLTASRVLKVSLLSLVKTRKLLKLFFVFKNRASVTLAISQFLKKVLR